MSYGVCYPAKLTIDSYPAPEGENVALMLSLR